MALGSEHEPVAAESSPLAKFVLTLSRPGAFNKTNPVFGSDPPEVTSCPLGAEGLACRQAEARRVIDNCPGGKGSSCTLQIKPVSRTMSPAKVVQSRLTSQRFALGADYTGCKRNKRILQPFRRFIYVTDHSPTLPSLYLCHNSLSNPSVALPMSQLIIQPFRCFTYVTAH